MNTSVTGVVRTDAGMCALWDPHSFHGVVDYATWERELLENEDIARHVSLGALVPVNIGSDGIFAVSLRSGSRDAPAALDDREVRYLVVASEPYLFVSAGEARLTGVEHVAHPPGDQGIVLRVAPGRYSVVVNLLDWQAEPGGADQSGKPTNTSLPDFLLLVNPAPAGFRPRLAISTFAPPDAP